MRPEKCIAALASVRLDSQPSNTRLDNQPPSSPPQTPPVAESDPAPRRATASPRPVSLVVRNTRKSRNKPFYAPTPRSNHYLLARSLVENDQPAKPLVPKRNPQTTRNTTPPQLCVLPPDFAISDFVWRFSTPDQDSQVHDAFAALRSYDPQTFSELIAGLD